jgi:hypothetical protein
MKDGDFIRTKNATDSVLWQVVGTNKFKAIGVFYKSTEPVNTATNDYTSAIWQNPSISVVAGETVDFTYQNNRWVNDNLNLENYGAKKDANSRAALLQNISLSKVINVKSGNYLIESEVLINKDSLHFKGEQGATFKFNTSSQQRMFRLESKGVVFENIIFDGNDKEVLYSLVYAHNNATVKFVNCKWINVKGVHANGFNNTTNVQYGFQMSTEGAEVDIENSEFKNITNTNLVNIEGVGFCGGIATIFDNFIEPAVQLKSAVLNVSNTKFSNIQTIMNTGLSVADNIKYDDADGIRFYSEKLFTVNSFISDCTFENISKRAVKNSDVKGVTISNIKISHYNMPYPMVNPVKIASRMTINNLDFKSDQPCEILIQIHTSSDIAVTNVTANKVKYGIVFTPLTANDTIRNIYFDNIKMDTVLINGTISSTVHARVDNIKFNALFINGIGATTIGFAPPVQSDNKEFYTLTNSFFKNSAVKISGNGNVDNINILIDNPLFKPTLNGVLESNTVSVSDVKMKVESIDLTFKTASNFLMYFYGTQTTVKDITLTVADAVAVSSYEAALNGSYSSYENITYNGIGKMMFGWFSNANPIKKTIFTNVVRRTINQLPTINFLEAYLIDSCRMNSIIDYSPKNNGYVIYLENNANNNRLNKVVGLMSSPINNAGTNNIDEGSILISALPKGVATTILGTTQTVTLDIAPAIGTDASRFEVVLEVAGNRQVQFPISLDATTGYTLSFSGTTVTVVFVNSVAASGKIYVNQH